MNISEMAVELENQIARSTKPWMRILAAIVLVLGTGGLFWHHLATPAPVAKHTASGTATSAKTSTSATLVETLHKAVESPAERKAEEQAKAAEQFGAALEKAGIPTQAGPSQN